MKDVSQVFHFYGLVLKIQKKFKCRKSTREKIFFAIKKTFEF